MSINSIRLSAYGFRMEAVGSKKFIKREKRCVSGICGRKSKLKRHRN